MQDQILADGGGRYGADPRRRPLSFVLALAMSLLLLAALWSVGLYDPPARHEGGTLTAVNLTAARGEKSDNPAPKAAQRAPQKHPRRLRRPLPRRARRAWSCPRKIRCNGPKASSR
jgi:protein TonB